MDFRKPNILFKQFVSVRFLIKVILPKSPPDANSNTENKTNTLCVIWTIKSIYELSILQCNKDHILFSCYLLKNTVIPLNELYFALFFFAALSQVQASVNRFISRGSPAENCPYEIFHRAAHNTHYTSSTQTTHLSVSQGALVSVQMLYLAGGHRHR